jgi:cytochrome c
MPLTTSGKIVIAAVAALAGAAALGAYSDAVFAPEAPAKRGYVIPEASAPQAAAPAPAAAATPAAAPTQAAAAPAAVAPAASLPALLAKADPARGQGAVKICQACHSFVKGGPAEVGPPLYDVVDRPVASIAGFSYTDGVKKIGGEWSFDKLDRWITKPSAMAPGTKMSYPGEPDPQKRADILAYLRTLSDSPVPLPQEAAR